MSLSFTLLSLLSNPASTLAIVHGGNPNLHIHVDQAAGYLTQGSVDLDKVRVESCGGGFTDYQVDQSIDPVAGFDLSISGGDLCGVELFWDSEMMLDGSGPQGAFSLSYDQTSTWIALPAQPQALTPWTPETGIVHGGNPNIYLSIN